ncbi:hypothetical protein AMECASPLE_032104 [Ameca splendens]|uniref:Uncharacterized protein n=1 Tax=Ameca splendens TaxID=208324 RepID=A0ABV0XVQ0_9TELE
MNRAICGETGGRDGITDRISAAPRDQLQLYLPSNNQTHITRIFLCAGVHMVCVSFMALSHLMDLLLNISQSNLVSPWQPCVTGGSSKKKHKRVHVSFRERETGRETEKKETREKE